MTTTATYCCNCGGAQGQPETNFDATADPAAWHDCYHCLNTGWCGCAPAIEGFLGSCECGFDTGDLPTKGLVRAAMQAHFNAVGTTHEWERLG